MMSNKWTPEDYRALAIELKSESDKVYNDDVFNKVLVAETLLNAATELERKAKKQSKSEKIVTLTFGKPNAALNTDAVKLEVQQRFLTSPHLHPSTA